jgi:hypothetical protein
VALLRANPVDSLQAILSNRSPVSDPPPIGVNGSHSETEPPISRLYWF